LPGDRVIRNLGIVRGIVVRSRSLAGNIARGLTRTENLPDHREARRASAAPACPHSPSLTRSTWASEEAAITTASTPGWLIAAVEDGVTAEWTPVASVSAAPVEGS
jgi:hypothetical protein